MPKSLKLRHAVFTAGIFILLAYQNCAQAPSEASDNTQSSYQLALPFAYKTTLDTISLMSCVDIEAAVDKRAYYTIRAGAYSSGKAGISTTKAFRDATNYYTATDRAFAFSQSEKNAGTRLTLSIRDQSNYQANWTTAAQALPDYEIDSFLPPLDSTDITGPLAASTDGQMINYFPGSGDQRLVEASLRFYKSKGDMDATRSTLEGNGILVAGYSATTDELNVALRGDTDASSNSVYGTGYLLSFTYGPNLSGGTFASGERRVLASVQEKDLSTGTTAVAPGWSCPANYRFMVVRPEDAVGKCLPTVDRFANASQQAQLEAVRRVLPVEDWFVDLTNHCVVPKRTGDFCYGKNLGTRAIQYYAATCVDNATQACPHYVSVCIRN